MTDLETHHQDEKMSILPFGASSIFYCYNMLQQASHNKGKEKDAKIWRQSCLHSCTKNLEISGYMMLWLGFSSSLCWNTFEPFI
jgi:glycerol dehydrogenase-like iron-containing ADH family enzyme